MIRPYPAPFFLSLLFALASHTLLHGQVVINEFMASNSTTLYDPDFNESADWIELHNKGQEEVNLEGYFLTDNLNNKDKWPLPFINLEPDHYILIYASGENINTAITWENIIDEGDEWKYIVPNSGTSTTWYTPSYSDQAWMTGNSGFGYGDGDDGTIIPRGTISVYLRKSFIVSSSEVVREAILHVDYDDGFIAYLNGHEIARGNLGAPGTIVHYNTTTNTDHEAKIKDGGKPDLFEIGNITELLRDGENLLAIEVHNVGSSSSDMTMIPFFSLGREGVSDGLPVNDLLELPGTGLHTNFRLAAGGEEIGLFSPTLELQDYIVYQRQATDISMGRSIESDEWFYFSEPTPGSPNNTLEYEDYTKNMVDFSVLGGLFNNELQLELSTYLGGDIWYSTDGSEPDEDDSLYESPLLIDSNTIIRARVFKPGQIPGPVTTQSYFFDTQHELPIVSLASDPLNFWDPALGIYVQDFKPDWEVPVNIELFENVGHDRAAFNERAGIKVNGLNSWRLPQKMLGVYFRNRYGKGKLDYQLFTDRSRVQFDDFALRQSGSDWSYTLFRDILGQELMATSSNVMSMGYKPVVVYLNGQYLGIHNVRSKVNDDFIIGNFGLEAETFDLIENEEVIESGDLDQYQELLKLLDKDLNNPDNYNAVASIMDIQNFADYMIAQMYVRNTSIGHNIMAWKPKDHGKWQWILMDLDRGFFDPETRLIDYFRTRDAVPFDELMTSDYFINYFAHRLVDHLMTTYHKSRVDSLIEYHKELLLAEMPGQIERWVGTTSNYGDAIPSREYWLNEIERLKDFASIRPGVLLNDLSNYGFNQLVDLQINVSSPVAGQIRMNGLNFTPGNQGQHLMGASIDLWTNPAPGYEFIGWKKEGSEDYIGLSDSISIQLDGPTYLIVEYQETNVCTVPTTIPADLTLSADCSPYFAIGNIHVPAGITLTIDKGVELFMPEQANLMVNGKLLINGNQSEPVKIRSNPSNIGPWGGIAFLSTEDTSRFNHVIIEGASVGPDPIRDKAAISVFKSDLILDHIIIEEVGSNPILVQYGDIQLSNSRLYSKITGDLINVKYGYAEISNTLFSGNDQPDTDGIDLDDVHDGSVINCQFYDFLGSNSDGIDIGEKSSNIHIDSIVTVNVTDKGVSVGQQSKVSISNSLFVNSNMGIAIKDSSFVTVDHCTFFNTAHAVTGYEKNPGRAGGNVRVTNSILSNSGISSTYIDSESSQYFDNNLSDTDPIVPTSANHTGNPMFINPEKYSFRLHPNSPANTLPRIGAPEFMLDKDPNVQICRFFPDYMKSGLPEFVSLVNRSNHVIDLQGYQFSEGIFAEIKDHLFLNPGDSLYLTSDAGSATWGDRANVMEWEDGKLSNTGEKIILRNSHGIIVDHIDYKTSAPWSAGDGIFTLISDSVDNHFGENWVLTEDKRTILSTDDFYHYSLQVFPNPAKNIINFRVNGPPESLLEIMNLSGKKILEIYPESSLITLDISSLPPGLYLVRYGGVSSLFIHTLE